MTWRFTLVFLTSLTALTLPVESLRAEGNFHLIAQAPAVDPGAAIDTGQTTPNFGSPSSISGQTDGSPEGVISPSLQHPTSQQQVDELKAIQQELKKRGFYDGPIDGIYGPGTAAAIQTLRGGQIGSPAGLNPGLAGTVPPAPDLANTPAALENNVEPESAPSDLGESGAADDGVQINAEAAEAALETEPITIGEEVSPETGVNAPEDEGAAAEAAAPGLGQLLWPGLALIAALGSFGIGFVVSNRFKPHPDSHEDAPWGSVPAAGPQLGTDNAPNGSNGQGSGQSHSDRVNPSGMVLNHTHQNNDSLPVVSKNNSAGATTRLARVDVMDELVSSLQMSDPVKRRKAIWELGQRGNSSAVQHLVDGMVDADSKEKSLILAALSEIGIRSLKPMNRALAIALQDENPDVRKNAIRDLTRVYDLVTQISQMLGHATEDEDSEVRRTAEWAIGQLNRIREAPQLNSSVNTLDAPRSPSELLPDEIENLKN